MKRDKILLLFIIILCTLPSYSQTLTYGYDLAGNRIKREIVMPSNDNSIKKAPGKAFVSEMLSDKTIRIYPNPTKGILKIEIANYEASDNGEIALFNFNGTRLQFHPISEPLTLLDLSGYDSGLYLMHISINGNESSWKIIKE